MIIFRYLSKQILQVMAAVTLILLVVAVTTRFIQYLGQAAAGELASDVLMLLMLYRLPDFLLIILPLALFLGILLAYGRMYAENEMTVLIACGMSQNKLLAMTLSCAILVTAISAILSLQAAPLGLKNTEQLKQSQDELTELDLIIAGQFQEFDRGGRVTYAERIVSGDNGRELRNVFVALSRGDAPGVAADASEVGSELEEESGMRQRSDERLQILTSESARPVVDAESGRRFMLLENGYIYDGIPGQADYYITRFAEQGLLLPERGALEPVMEEKALPTSALWGSAETAHRAELQWRLSVIVMIPILTLIGVPMSRVSPRQGRYGKLVPAALLYALYYVLLQISRDRLQAGNLPVQIGLWWVHSLFLAGGLFFMFRRQAGSS